MLYSGCESFVGAPTERRMPDGDVAKSNPRLVKYFTSQSSIKESKPRCLEVVYESTALTTELKILQLSSEQKT